MRSWESADFKGVVRLHKGIVKFLSFLSLVNSTYVCYNAYRSAGL